MYVREGIVMASDSRLTLNTEQRKEEKQVVQIAVGQSDSNYKTFLTPNNIGISTYGTAEIKGVPIAGYIESFMIEHLSTKKNIDQVPRLLLGYFQQFQPPPSTQFHVAGYKEEQSQQHQHVWHVDVANNKIGQLNPPGKPGASWGGEADILARLIQPVAIVDNQNEAGQPLPYFPIPWQFFTLQDAIDFCIFAVRSTIDAIRFQPRPKTVGGPIDVLVIKPDKAFWVQRKELHG
jgi:20S proteasome alpha/beta subunit